MILWKILSVILMLLDLIVFIDASIIFYRKTMWTERLCICVGVKEIIPNALYEFLYSAADNPAIAFSDFWTNCDADAAGESHMFLVGKNKTGYSGTRTNGLFADYAKDWAIIFIITVGIILIFHKIM